MMPSDRCEHCGQQLYLDRESAVQLARHGVVGGRFFCVAGCTDIWIKRRPSPPPPDPVESDGRGKYTRHERTFVCARCHVRRPTRGTNTRRCKACQADLQRERDRQRWLRKCARSRAAAS